MPLPLQNSMHLDVKFYYGANWEFISSSFLYLLVGLIHDKNEEKSFLTESYGNFVGHGISIFVSSFVTTSFLYILWGFERLDLND